MGMAFRSRDRSRRRILSEGQAGGWITGREREMTQKDKQKHEGAGLCQV